MNSNRPSLANAFAPSPPRGSKLEGILAPKRKRDEQQTGEGSAKRDNEPTQLIVVPDASREREPIDVLASSNPEPDSDHADVADVQAKEAVTARQTERSKSQQTEKKHPKSNAKASASVPGAPRNVGVYLAPDLLAEVKEAAHSQRTTYADLLLDAFDALDPGLIEREFRPATVQSTSGMPRRTVRRRSPAGIQIQVRLDDEQIAWLDERVVEFNAPSRSALVSTAFKLHLAGE